jgi:small multidrug resistance pump
MIFYYACLAFSVVAGAAGQILLKIGALNQVRNNLPLFLERITLAGFVIYFIAAIAYVVSLRRVPLTIAFPSVSLSYFFVSYAAHLVLGESFTSANIFALGLISVGIFILASS